MLRHKTSYLIVFRPNQFIVWIIFLEKYFSCRSEKGKSFRKHECKYQAPNPSNLFGRWQFIFMKINYGLTVLKNRWVHWFENTFLTCSVSSSSANSNWSGVKFSPSNFSLLNSNCLVSSAIHRSLLQKANVRLGRIEICQRQYC